MNRKAFQLAISTLILIVLGLLVLIALIVSLTGGLDRFKNTTDPYLETTEAIAVKQACELACETNTESAFCCTDRELNNEMLKCSDSKMQITCNNIDCSTITC